MARRLENQTLGERVYTNLRADILDLTIPPGSVLQEVPLAEELGVSRGPLREALNRLAAEGLVTITPRKGAVVTLLTKRDFLDAYQVREVLEALAVKNAVPRLTPGDFAEFDRLMRIMSDAAARNDATSFFEANSDFHEAFVVASGNAKNLEIYRMLIGQMGPYRRPSATLRGSLDVSIAEHRDILEAARAGDSERTTELVLQHIRVPQQRLLSVTEEEFLDAIGAIRDPAEATN
jgi:DNA-binding GntR family transcriptional regulator